MFGFVTGLIYGTMSFGFVILITRTFIYYDESKYIHTYINNKIARRIAYSVVELLEIVKKVYQVASILCILPSLVCMKLGMKPANQLSTQVCTGDNTNLKNDRILQIRRTIRAMAHSRNKSNTHEKIEMVKPDHQIAYKTVDDNANVNIYVENEKDYIDKDTNVNKMIQYPNDVEYFDVVNATASEAVSDTQLSDTIHEDKSL